MKRIIISIIVIGCLLSTTILNVNGEETIINTENLVSIEIQTLGATINYNENSMTDYSYTFSETDLNSIESIETPSQSGSLDFAITELNAWYCPFPPRNPGTEDWRYECFKYMIYNIGDAYTGSGQIKVLFTIFYADGSEHTNTMMNGEYEGRFLKNMLIQYNAQFYATLPQDCNAIKAKLEIITTFPDNNPENNVLTVDWTTGITFWGKVYEKYISGDTNYADYAEVKSDSDCDKVIGSDKVASFGTPFYSEGHPFYTHVAPKNPNKPAYQYKIKAYLYTKLQNFFVLSRIQTRFTEPLNGMSYKEMFFTFIRLDINQNSQSTSQSQSTQQSQSSSQSTTQSSSTTQQSLTGSTTNE